MSVMQRFRSMMRRGRINELMRQAVNESTDATARAKALAELERLDSNASRDLFARDGRYIHEHFVIHEPDAKKR